MTYLPLLWNRHTYGKGRSSASRSDNVIRLCERNLKNNVVDDSLRKINYLAKRDILHLMPERSETKTRNFYRTLTRRASVLCTIFSV